LGEGEKKKRRSKKKKKKEKKQHCLSSCPKGGGRPEKWWEKRERMDGFNISKARCRPREKLLAISSTAFKSPVSRILRKQNLEKEKENGERWKKGSGADAVRNFESNARGETLHIHKKGDLLKKIANAAVGRKPSDGGGGGG